MANNVKVVFSGDTTQLLGVINKTQVSLQKFTFKLKQEFLQMASGVYLAQEAFDALRRTIGGPLAAASQFEDTRLAIRRFVGDVELADDLLRRLDERSVKTPFEPTELQAVAQSLLAAKIEFGEIFDIVNELGAVAKDGRQLQELGDALAKGFAKGKFQTEELNKFLERGINLRGELTRITGKSGEALDKAIQKGLKFEDVRAAIAAMSEEGGQFYGMLEERSQTASGLLSTLSGLWTELQKRFAMPVNDGLKPVLVEAAAQLESLLPLAEDLGTLLVEGAGKAVPVMGQVLQLVQSLGAYLPLIIGALATMGAMWLAKRVAATNAITGIKGQLSGLRAQLLALRIASASAGGGFRGMQAAATVAISGIKAQLVSLGVTLRSVVASSGIGAVMVAFSVAAEKIGQDVGEAMKQLQAARAEERRMRDFDKTLRARRAERDKVDSVDGREKLRQRLLEDIRQLEERRRDVDLDVEGADNQALARSNFTRRIMDLEMEIKQMDKLTAANIIAGDRRRRAAEAAREQAEAEKAAQEALKKSREELGKLAAEEAERMQMEKFKRQSLGDQRSQLLAESGLADLREIERSIQGIANTFSAMDGKVSLSEEEVARYKRLVEIRRQLLDIDKEQAEMERARQQAARDYEANIAMLQAEIAGNQEKLELLKQQQRVRELTRQFEEAGLSNAEQKARRQAELERQAAGGEPAGAQGPGAGRSVIAESLARIGGGGRAFTIDNSVLAENRRQSRLQERIARATEKTADKPVPDNSTAVYA